MNKGEIKPCTFEHLDRYGEIYAKAFSREPWNNPWKPEDASLRVKEILDIKDSYGLEYVIDGDIVGFVIGSPMLSHNGITFEIKNLAVDPDYQRRGIANKLMNACLEDLKKKGVVGFLLFTADDGILPKFYEKFGFKKENKVILMETEI